ncbi:MAG: tRNA (adenosine(37)-N6)-dimethylallyltransferase MiaA [Planctomycetota bacterium]
MNAPRALFIVTGQTAAGKDEATARAAERIGAEIFSLDAIKVYRRMEVGTDKPPREWRERLSYHALDLVDPSESFNVGRYLRYCEEELATIPHHKPVFFCGGTGLYLLALVRGLFEGPPSDSAVRQRLHAIAEEEGAPELHRRLTDVDAEAAGRIHPNDRKRLVRALEVFELTGRPISQLQREGTKTIPGIRPVVMGLRRESERLRERIRLRAEAMVRDGLLDETRDIAESGGFSREAGEALGYRQALAVLAGELNKGELAERIAGETWRFARRQATWFRSFEEIEWIDLPVEADPGEAATELLARLTSRGELA